MTTDVSKGRAAKLYEKIKDAAAVDAMEYVEKETNEVIGKVLALIHPSYGFKILNRLPADRSEEITRTFPSELSERWRMTRRYSDGSLGRLMEKVHCVLSPGTTVAAAIEAVRREVNAGNLITYAYVAGDDGTLQGVIVLRDLMLATAGQPVHEVMIRKPFYFEPDMQITDAMKAMVKHHVPVYPLCGRNGVLVGIVRGNLLFEEHAVELSAQSGRMVGVTKEEMLHTHWLPSLKFRHPWLQLNLLTAFLAAMVVGLFEDTIAQVVLLAAFLPVVAGQSGNTGCQSLAVTLRGMTLDEFKTGSLGKSLKKEMTLGLVNGTLVGITAAVAMFVYAAMNHNADALALALVVFVTMVGSCVVSGITGVAVPTTLKRFGADPATASSIFLTTFTDVASMGLFLLLATVLIL